MKPSFYSRFHSLQLLLVLLVVHIINDHYNYLSNYTRRRLILAIFGVLTCVFSISYKVLNRYSNIFTNYILLLTVVLVTTPVPIFYKQITLWRLESLTYHNNPYCVINLFCKNNTLTLYDSSYYIIILIVLIFF